MNTNSKQKRIAFGYNRNGRNEIALHEGQAATVKLIFQYYIEGCSISLIKQRLEGMGIPSPLNGKNWSKQTLANILSNPHYTGDATYPIIISEEQFLLAQKLKHEHTSKLPKTKTAQNLARKGSSSDSFTTAEGGSLLQSEQ